MLFWNEHSPNIIVFDGSSTKSQLWLAERRINRSRFVEAIALGDSWHRFESSPEISAVGLLKVVWYVHIGFNRKSCLAARFRIDCSRSSWCYGTRGRLLLKWSAREIMKELTRWITMESDGSKFDVIVHRHCNIEERTEVPHDWWYINWTVSKYKCWLIYQQYSTMSTAP